MLPRKYLAIYILISHTLLLSAAKENINNNGSKTNDIDNELRHFEEKLKNLKQMLAEEQQKTKQTTETPLKQEQNKTSTPQNSSELTWFSGNNVQAAKEHLEAKINDFIEIFNPINYMPSPDNLMKPLEALTAATLKFIPESLRLSFDIGKLTIKFSHLMTRDMPQILQRLPESIEGLITSLNSMRKNSTAPAQNQTDSLFNRISKHLFVWSVLSAQTELMATLSFGLMYRSYIQVLKATPLPAEAVKLQTALNTMILRLSETLPLVIRVLQSGVHGDASDELAKLFNNINNTNKAMDAFQNQTNSFQQLMDRTPITSNIVDDNTLEQFHKSMAALVMNVNKIPENIPALTSLFFKQGRYLIEFLGELSRTFTKSGIGINLPDNIKNIQQRILKVFNITSLAPFLNSTSPLGNAAVQLLSDLQSLFIELQTNLMTPGYAITKPLNVAIDCSIKAVHLLKSSNVFIPPFLLEPMLTLLDMASKFIKIGNI